MKEITNFCLMIVFININSPNDYSYQTGHVPCKRIRYSRDLDTQINNDIKSGNIKVEISRDHAEFLLLLVLFLSSAELRRQLAWNFVQIYSMCICGELSNYWPV